MKDYYVWTQTLTERGSALARATFDVIDGRGERKAVEDARAMVLTYCKDGLARLEQAQTTNKLPAFQTWAVTAVAYARWECVQVEQICDGMLRRLADTTGTPEARKSAILEWIAPLDEAERAHKAEIEAATRALYAALNGTAP